MENTQLVSIVAYITKDKRYVAGGWDQPVPDF